MKKLMAFLFVLSVAYAQVGIISSDTVRIKTSWIPVAAYASGDIIRATDTAFFSISTGSNFPTSGFIRSVIVETDTPNVANASFMVRFYNFRPVDTTGTGAAAYTDTLGYNILQAVDNSPVLNSYHKFTKYLVGDVAATVQPYGVGTGATAVNFAPILPFTTYRGKLWVSLIAFGSYTPKKGGAYRIKVVFERYNR